MSDRVYARIRRRLIDGEPVEHAIRAETSALTSMQQLSDMRDHVAATLNGPGAQVSALLETPGVTDVLINPDGVWVDDAHGLRRVDLDPEVRRRLEVSTEQQRRALAVRMAAACGVRLDDASPIADGQLPDGTRLHAVLHPLAVDGTVMSLRTRRRDTLTLDDLERLGSIDATARRLITRLIESRASVVVSGATGSGKTTLLGAAIHAMRADERIVCIEDVPELRLNHPHAVMLAARRPNVHGEGEVTLADLVRAAMRMRPDRLILGEARGGEVRDVLTAFNTGHDGGWVTVHANSAEDVAARLVALGALANLAVETVSAQAVAALDAVIHMGRDSATRQVVEIAVIPNRLPLRMIPAWRRGSLCSDGWRMMEQRWGV